MIERTMASVGRNRHQIMKNLLSMKHIEIKRAHNHNVGNSANTSCPSFALAI